jgi:hypothetical protein
MQRFLVACVAAFLAGMTAGCSGPNDSPEKGNNSPEKGTVEREERGEFRSIHGQTGQQSFGITFASPPKVTLHTTAGGEGGQSSSEQENALDHSVILETTTTGFKWKNTGRSKDCDAKLYWVAKGLVNK